MAWLLNKFINETPLKLQRNKKDCINLTKKEQIKLQHLFRETFGVAVLFDSLVWFWYSSKCFCLDKVQTWKFMVLTITKRFLA